MKIQMENREIYFSVVEVPTITVPDAGPVAGQTDVVVLIVRGVPLRLSYDEAIHLGDLLRKIGEFFQDV